MHYEPDWLAYTYIRPDHAPSTREVLVLKTAPRLHKYSLQRAEKRKKYSEGAHTTVAGEQHAGGGAHEQLVYAAEL